MIPVGISLGMKCDSAVWGVVNGLRNTKENGYKTCPFDEMLTNYPGLIECLKDDFKITKHNLDLFNILIDQHQLNLN